MARVFGPSRDELDARGDEFAARVTRAIRTTLRDVAATTRDVDDLTRIQTIWRSVVANSLAPRLRREWNTTVEGVREQLEKINERQRALTAAVFEIPQVSNPLAETFLAEATNRLTAIGDIVWYTARGEMLTGLQLGEGVAELKERVVASANVSAKRAAVIARTEINSAMNNGAYEQMKALDVATVKEWIATNDSRTRESHEEVDGEEIDGDAKFMVGGFPMDHPHDLNGPPSETINCRCTLAWEIVDDDDDFDNFLVAGAFHLPGKHEQKKHGHRYQKPGDKSSGLRDTKSSKQQISAKGQRVIDFIEDNTKQPLPPSEANGHYNAFVNPNFSASTEAEFQQVVTDEKAPDAMHPGYIQSDRAKAWLPIKKVNPAELVQTQKWLRQIDLTQDVSPDEGDREAIVVYRAKDGTLYLTNGHHRVNLALAKGLKEIEVREATATMDVPSVVSPRRHNPRNEMSALTAAGDFDESKHKRDGKGRFAKKAGGPSGGKGKKLKITHGIVHKKHAPGTIIAVSGADDKRLVWDGNKYLLQRKQADGGWVTESTAIKSKAYVEIGKFGDDWHEPASGDATEFADADAIADAINNPKPSSKFAKPKIAKSKVSKPSSSDSSTGITQDLFDKKYDVNDVVIESDDGKHRVVWDGKHYRHQRWNGLLWTTEQLYTKDNVLEKVEATGLKWRKPIDWLATSDESTSEPEPTAKSKKTTAAPKSGKAGSPLKITHALVHSKYEPGTVLTENGAGDKRVVWDGAEYRLQRKTVDGNWTSEKSVKKSKAYAEINAYDSDWRTPAQADVAADSDAQDDIELDDESNDFVSPFDIPQTGPKFPKTKKVPLKKNATSQPATATLTETEKASPLTGYKKVGGQAGSNTGGLYQAPDGEKWYVKAPKTDDHARNEVLANRLYERAGVKVPHVELADLSVDSPFPGKTGLGIKSKIVDGDRDLQSKVLKSESFKAKLYENFAVDAWLGNWDVVGLGYDNVITTKGDEPLRIDAGGSLLFRAKGIPKGSAFGDKVVEIDTLRNYSVNSQAANVFSGVTDDDIRKGVAKIEAIQPAEIDALVDDAGFKGKTAQRLKDTLKARRADLVARFGSNAPKSSTSPASTASDAPAPTPVPTSTPAPAVTPTPVTTPAAQSGFAGVKPKSMFDLTKVKPHKNGAIFADPGGIEYFVNPSPSEAHARNQFLAANLYNFAGVGVEQTDLVDIDPDKLPGHSGVGVKAKRIEKSQFADVTNSSTLSDKAKQQLAQGFAIDAWLGNHNVTGTGGDNLVVSKYGDVYRTNIGGSLLFRSNGLPKKLSDTVDEIDSLRNPNINPTAAKIFANVTDDDIRAAVLNLEKLQPKTIDFIVEQSGFTGDEADAIKKKLKARRQDLIDRFGSLTTKPTEDTTPAPTSAPTPAPSSQPTATNALGGTKTFTALQKAKVKSIFDKNNVKWYNKTNLIYDTALEVSKTHSDITIGDALDIMDGTLKKSDKPFRTKVEKWLKTNAGMHHAIAVGGSAPLGGTSSTVSPGALTPNVSAPLGKPAVEFNTPLPRELTAQMADTLQERMNKAWPPPWNASQRAALTKYTGDAYVAINNCLRGLDKCTPATLETIKQIKNAVKPSTDIIVVYRRTNPSSFGLSSQDLGLTNLEKSLQEFVGKTFEDKGVTSTSIRNGAWHGLVHMEIEIPKGARIAWVKRLSKHAHEDELILAPGTRFDVLSVEPTPNPQYPGDKTQVMKLRVIVDEV
jgi:SPP1 gp7 family putative phage head morphogenesis protein